VSCREYQVHGTNGLRTIINDYAEKDQTRFLVEGPADHRLDR